MTAVEQALAYVKQRERARTPDIARHIGMSPPDVDLLLERPCSDGMLITCTVTLGDGREVKEYRPTNAPAPKLALGSLSIPKFTDPWPASAAAKTEDDMTKQHQIKDALRAHGPMTTHELSRHVNVRFLTQVVSKLAESGEIVRLGGPPRGSIWGLKGQTLPSAAPAQQAAPAAAPSGDFTSVIAGLEEKRLALMVEVEKIDNAIAAVRALG